MEQKVYVHIRVSSVDQNESGKFTAMQNLQIPMDRIFIDKQSGKILSGRHISE